MDSTGQLTRQHIRLFKFEFDFEHRARKKQKVGDVPPQFNTLNEDTTPLEDNSTLLSIDAQEEFRSHTWVKNANSDDLIPLDIQLDASLNSPSTEEKFEVEQALNQYCKSGPTLSRSTIHRVPLQ